MAKSGKPTEATFAPAIIVFGLDEGQRPHAAAFNLNDAMLAERAAGLMGMSVLKVITAEHRTAASGLPVGRVFASGKAFTPFVAKPLYDRLVAFDGAFKPEPPKAGDPLPSVSNIPSDWKQIGAGSLVLAGEESGGWYEAVISELKDGMAVLRWTGWPDLPPFVRRVEHLSLLSAAAHEAVASAAA